MATATATPTVNVHVEMTMDKETKGAVRYAADTEFGLGVLPTVYVRRDAFTGTPPTQIRVSITNAADVTV